MLPLTSMCALGPAMVNSRTFAEPPSIRVRTDIRSYARPLPNTWDRSSARTRGRASRLRRANRRPIGPTRTRGRCPVPGMHCDRALELLEGRIERCAGPREIEADLDPASGRRLLVQPGRGEEPGEVSRAYGGFEPARGNPVLAAHPASAAARPKIGGAGPQVLEEDSVLGADPDRLERTEVELLEAKRRDARVERGPSLRPEVRVEIGAGLAGWLLLRRFARRVLPGRDRFLEIQPLEAKAGLAGNWVDGKLDDAGHPLAVECEMELGPVLGQGEIEVGERDAMAEGRARRRCPGRSGRFARASPPARARRPPRGQARSRGRGRRARRRPRRARLREAPAGLRQG